jgi:hypothetical protein
VTTKPAEVPTAIQFSGKTPGGDLALSKFCALEMATTDIVANAIAAKSFFMIQSPVPKKQRDISCCADCISVVRELRLVALLVVMRDLKQLAFA